MTRTKSEALARAKECLAQIRTGTPFAEVVSTCTDEPSGAQRAGQIGSVTRDKFVKPFADAALDLCVGDVSEPVETPFGYTLILRTK